MPLRKPQTYSYFIENLSASALQNQNPKLSSPNWRSEVQQNQLVSQISAVLLQRQPKYWAPLLKGTLKFSNLTPSLFTKILRKTRAFPQISLNFFNWAKSNLGFRPDLKSQCRLASVLYGSGLSALAKPILGSLIQDYSSAQIVYSFCKDAEFSLSHSPVLSSVLEGFCNQGMCLQALNVYQKAQELGHVANSTHSCNALLNLLQEKNEIRHAWCLYGSMIRNGVIENQFTWSTIARILRKGERFDRIVRILDVGVPNSAIYNLIIDCYSQRGNFDAAFGYLSEMCDRKLYPNFSTHGSILDGACKYQNVELIEKVMGIMAENGHLPKCFTDSEYDAIIQKLCGLGKTYAAEMFLQRASVEEIELKDTTYGCMLRAFSNEDRVKDATRVYCILLEKKMEMNDSCYIAFVKVLCKQTPSTEVHQLLKEIIEKGFLPSMADLSKYIRSACYKLRWREAEELLNLMMERGFLPEPSCYCSLVKHYCSGGWIDSAIKLHKKMESLNGSFDLSTYNVLLSELFKQNKAEQAQEIFTYMQIHRILGTESFTIMITGLCRAKEPRTAMKLHDNMLSLGLKPEKGTYKRLIACF